MGKGTFVLAAILIVAGLALIVYQDPQFRFVYNTFVSSSSSSTSSTVRFTSGGSSTSPQSISTSYSVLDIVESLVGAGLVGIGLVVFGIQIFALSKLNPLSD